MPTDDGCRWFVTEDDIDDDKAEEEMTAFWKNGRAEDVEPVEEEEEE